MLHHRRHLALPAHWLQQHLQKLQQNAVGYLTTRPGVAAEVEAVLDTASKAHLITSILQVLSETRVSDSF